MGLIEQYNALQIRRPGTECFCNKVLFIKYSSGDEVQSSGDVQYLIFFENSAVKRSAMK